MKKANLINNFSIEDDKKNALNNFIFSSYKKKYSIKKLIKEKSNITDNLIKDYWNKNNLNNINASLLAVGGYGRRELYPFSDIDILILLKDYNDLKNKNNIENFIADIWKLKTSVGHSVRDIEECIKNMNKDVTVYTNILDVRFIEGDKKLYNDLIINIKKNSIWTKKKFLIAKKNEQNKRYQKYSNTGYLVEPDIKEGPGGFRDLQTLLWIAKKIYNIKSLADLYSLEIISKKEYLSLLKSERFLSKTRFLLHYIHNKAEERLYFASQKKLAHLFGYQIDKNIGVENYMQRFYKHITNIKQLNEILIKHFENVINEDNKLYDKSTENDFFIFKNGAISVKNKNVFIKDPSKLFEIFLQRDNNGNLYEISANTIRQIKESLYLIDKNFKSQKKNKELFLSIFYQKNGVARCLRKMNDYGVLASYLKPFSRIVGMMQFDLFHIYTVDEHTLSVLSNARFMSTEECKKKYPFVFEIFKNLRYPEILYLGAIFHDIGKGRNKDHSNIGSNESLKFCREHGINKHQSVMVAWLVENHLLMSLTIQKKDIGDSLVIKEFADKVKTQERLDYLYLLTIADIRGTNPSLYTDWKDSLLRELYLSSKSYFRKNIFVSKKTDRYLKNLKESVKRILYNKINIKDFNKVWLNFDTDYLRRHSEEEIAGHIELIIINNAKNAVSIKDREVKGCTELTVYQSERNNIFSYVANIIDNLNINIVDAKIITLKNNQALDTYLIIDENGKFIKDKHILNFLKDKIMGLLNSNRYEIKKITKKQTHNIASFKNFISIEITEKTKELLIEVSTLDHPGLLSKICESLDSCNLMVKDAKISTLGEEANDVFIVLPLKNEKKCINYIENIKNTIRDKISDLHK